MEELINIAREKISSYCLSSCEAECCKRGTMKISDNQVELMTKGNMSLVKSLPNNEYRVKITPCVNESNNKCSVYKKRPVVCREFPIRVFNLKETIISIGKCKAVDSGVIDEELNTLKLKYKIIK